MIFNIILTLILMGVYLSLGFFAGKFKANKDFKKNKCPKCPRKLVKVTDCVIYSCNIDEHGDTVCFSGMCLINLEDYQAFLLNFNLEDEANYLQPAIDSHKINQLFNESN